MRTYIIKKYGGLEVINEQDMPIPNIGDHDVLIEIENTAISPYDWHVRIGEQAGKLDYPIPI